MPRVIRGTKDRKKEPVVVEKTGHPAAFRKVRCPHCKLGMAVADPNQSNLLKCDRCGQTFKVNQM